MKVLTHKEMNDVSGGFFLGGLWNTASSAVSFAASTVSGGVLGAVAGFAGGAVIGGKHGGNGGGILGFGAIGQGVGMLAGGTIGAICGGIGAVIVGYDSAWEYTQKLMDGFFSGSLVP